MTGPMNAPAPPTPDPLVEKLFDKVMQAPDGYDYYGTAPNFAQILYPVFGSNQWRLLLRNRETGEVVPVFIEGSFILKLTKALNAMQRELNQAVSDDIGEPVKHTENVQ